MELLICRQKWATPSTITFLRIGIWCGKGKGVSLFLRFVGCFEFVCCLCLDVNEFVFTKKKKQCLLWAHLFPWYWLTVKRSLLNILGKRTIKEQSWSESIYRVCIIMSQATYLTRKGSLPCFLHNLCLFLFIYMSFLNHRSSETYLRNGFRFIFYHFMVHSCIAKIRLIKASIKVHEKLLLLIIA